MGANLTIATREALNDDVLCQCDGRLFIGVLMDAISSMFHAGSEIYLRKPSSYHLSPDQDCSFEQLNELCRLRKETALGYIINDGGVQLNPLSSASHCFCSSDRVIVQAAA